MVPIIVIESPNKQVKLARYHSLGLSKSGAPIVAMLFESPLLKSLGI